ncbi:unnamed protein product [Closterium sp. NIES-65]|nr:unnamed protein product [Closterium sp. NIES-65]
MRRQARGGRRALPFQGAWKGPEKVQVLSRADMVHYVDVRGAWDWRECECCFDRAVSYRAQRALGMVRLRHFRCDLQRQLPDSIPLAPQERPSSAMVEDSARVPLRPLEPLEEWPPQQLFGVKCVVAPIRCAEAMILEWMAEPRVGVLMDLGRIRSRLPAILAATDAATAATSPATAAALAAAASGTWATRWAAYRRAFGAGRQVENDCIASVLVQVLGVKEGADLQEGFGFFVQHVLSGGLEKAHGEEKGRGAAGGEGAEKTHWEEGGTGGEAAEKAQGEEGRADGEMMDRGGGMEKEEEQVAALARLIASQVDAGGGRDGGEPKHSSEASKGGERHSSGAANGAAGEGGRRGKNGQWRENLKGHVWERYVDGMAWILEHGGGEGREFRCSQCSEEGSQCSEEGSQCSEEGSQCSEEGSQCSEEGSHQCSEEGSQCSEEGSQCSEEGSQCSDEGSQCNEEGSQCSEEGSQCSEESNQCSEEGSQCSEEGSQCSEEGSNNGGDVQVNGAPKGMYVSGVGATDFALAFATELSKPESCAEACMYILDGNNANKVRVEEAAIQEARSRLRRGVGGKGRKVRSGGTGGDGAAANTSGAAANTSGAAANTSGAAANTSGAAANRSGEAAKKIRAAASTTGAVSNTIREEANTSGAGANTSGAGANTSKAGANRTRAAEASVMRNASAFSAAASDENRPCTRVDGTCASYNPGLVPVNTNPVFSAFTYRVARILQWVRIYGSDVVFVDRCCKSKPQNKILEMPHPFRDLPSLLLRLGAIPKPLDDADFAVEWEEWPQGDEAALKLPDDPNARFFLLGISEESGTGVESEQRVTEVASKSGRKHTRRKVRGAKAPGQASDGSWGHTDRGIGGVTEQKGIPHPFGMAVIRPPPRRKLPIVRCVADAESLVEGVGQVVTPPACTHCVQCFRDYYLLLPSIALIAKYAYRPLYVLFNRFLSVFPPQSFGFHTLVKDMGLPPFPSRPAPPTNLAILRGEIEKERVTFLLLVALKWPASILDLEQFEGKELLEGDAIRVKKKVATGRKKGKARRGMGNGGEEEEEEDDGEVQEELESWCFTAQNAWPSSLRVSLRDADVESEDSGSGLSDVCMGSEGQQERVDMNTRIADLVSTGVDKMRRKRVQLRRGGAVASSSTGKGNEGKGKKAELPPYLKAWPGGVNLLACLREMLLGEPCYCPASPAAPSVHPGVNITGAAPSTTASASSSLAAPTTAAPNTAVLSTHPPVHTCATMSTYAASSPHVTPTTGAAIGTADTAACAEASALDASRESRCSAAGCGRMEGGGVKLRSCGGCGKVAYCSRECQKAHWP